MALSTRQQHVVAVPLPAQGHINPLMRFCKLLASHGVLVTFVDIDAVHHRLEELKQDEEEKEGKQNVHEDEKEEKQDGEHAAEKVRRAYIPIQHVDLANDFRISLETFFENVAAPLEALIHELNRQGPPVTCLISDFGLTFPTQNLADKLNIPWVVLFPASASLLLLFYYITQGERPRISTIKVLESLSRRAECKEVICDGLEGLPTIYNNEIPQYKHVVDDTVYMWEYVAKACGEPFRRAHAMVINSFDNLMALSKHLSFPIYGVGPLVAPLQKESSTSLWKEDEACILWLGQQSPLSVLYISFGSITLLSQSQLEEIVAGLLSSQQRFLWVFRPDLVDNIEYSSTFAFDVVSRSHGKGYVVHWAPQLQVLSHPSVGGFLTHCGWNSTTEAVAHGVPMLCWPYFVDQMLDAKYIVEEWKVGLQFEASKADACLVQRDEVERVIKALLEGEEGRVLRKNARCLKEASSESLLPQGTCHNNIRSLIKSLMQGALKKQALKASRDMSQ